MSNYINSSRPIPVMVTGVGGGGHGEQILKALRLAQTPYEIIGGDMSPYSSGLLNVDHPYLLPPASAPNYMETVLKVCKKHGVQVLLHGSEPELKVMSAHRAIIEEAGIFLPINPKSVIDLCMDKVKTTEFLLDKGFKLPAFQKVRSIEDAMAFNRIPAVLKPSVGGGGSANIYLARDLDELVLYAKHLLTLYEEFIIQEYVGTANDEYTVGVLSDMDGNLINSIAVRRYILSSLSNRIKIPGRANGKDSVLAISNGISQGEIGRFPEVTAQCEQIAKAVGSKGPLNVQCRLVEDTVYVFEINPRFSGTTSLRAMVGYNEPDILIRKHILGEEIPQHFPYDNGVIMRHLAETLIQEPEFPVAAELP